MRYYELTHDIELEGLSLTVQATVRAEYHSEEPDSPEGVTAIDACYDLPEDIYKISDELDMYITNELLNRVETDYRILPHD